MLLIINYSIYTKDLHILVFKHAQYFTSNSEITEAFVYFIFPPNLQPYMYVNNIKVCKWTTIYQISMIHSCDFKESSPELYSYLLQENRNCNLEFVI